MRACGITFHCLRACDIPHTALGWVLKRSKHFNEDPLDGERAFPLGKDRALDSLFLWATLSKAWSVSWGSGIACGIRVGGCVSVCESFVVHWRQWRWSWFNSSIQFTLYSQSSDLSLAGFILVCQLYLTVTTAAAALCNWVYVCASVSIWDRFGQLQRSWESIHRNRIAIYFAFPLDYTIIQKDIWHRGGGGRIRCIQCTGCLFLCLLLRWWWMVRWWHNALILVACVWWCSIASFD